MATSRESAETPPAVVVRGEAKLAAAPDEVEIALDLDVRERSAEKASEELGRRSAAIAELLDELDVPSERRATTGVLVREEREWEKSRLLFTGYRAWTRLTLRLADFAPLATILSGAVERTEAEVSGPWWRATDDHPARAEVCAQAATQARRKAEAYAAALGVRLGPVVRIADPGTGVSAGGPPYMQPVVAPAATRGEAAPMVEVEPGTIDLHAAVEVTFRLET